MTPKSQRNPTVRALYTPLVEAARQRIINDETIAAIIDPQADPSLVLGFLIHFSALGVDMTRRVEEWIERAGRRCQELGHVQLGRALVMHARHEAGHHTMMIDDLHKLVPRWNQDHELQLDVEELLELPATDAMKRYDAIHEATINSETPYGQIAIEYEVEGMSVVLGPALMQACSRAIGQDIVKEMSFIEEHAALDIGHTAMNEAELEKFLSLNPADAEALAQIGVEALDIYLDFLGECVTMGLALADAARQQQVAASA